MHRGRPGRRGLLRVLTPARTTWALQLRHPRTLMWLCLGVVATFAYLRMGREQPPPVPRPPPAHAGRDDGVPIHPREKLAAKRARIGGGLTLPPPPPLHGWDGKSIRTVQDAATAPTDVPPMPNKKGIPQMHAAVPQRSESVRCRHSGICARPSHGGCSKGKDKLGCVTEAPERRERVRKAIKWSWRAYERCAYGQDELQPLSCEGGQWIGLGLTLVDALDTLILAGFDEDVAKAVSWIESALDPARPDKDNDYVSHFETTIRILGGLLSAWHLRGAHAPLLGAAVDTGLRLLCAYNNADGVPSNVVSMGELISQDAAWTASVSLAEVTTLTLEFNTLARAAGWPAIAEPVNGACKRVFAAPGQKAGLAPIYIRRSTRKSAPTARGVRFRAGTVTLGARGDSHYEYLLKHYIANGKRDKEWLRAYMAAMDGLRNWLVAETMPAAEGGLLFVGEMSIAEIGGAFSALRALGKIGAPPLRPKMDHLVCFLPGVLALGHMHGIETGVGQWRNKLPDMLLAERLLHTCNELYRQTPTGLAPEIAIFDTNPAEFEDVGNGHFYVKPLDARNLLRPETVESLFVMWRATRNETYRDWAWDIFRAFEMHARLPEGGYTDLHTVLHVPPERSDNMESFWLGETLKYLLLIFSPEDVLPLDEYVFNTEAHPLPILNTKTERALRASYLRGPDGIDLQGERYSPEVLRRAVDFYRAAVPRAAYDQQRKGYSALSQLHERTAEASVRDWTPLDFQGQL